MSTASDTGPLDNRADSLIAELRIAASFLTILPILPRGRIDDARVADSFGWFPLIGFALGVALCVEDAILARFFALTLRSILIVLSITIVTGALHLDGLADTADALGAGRDRTRALEILRDSRIGAYGTAAIFFSLALKIVTLATLAGARRYTAIFAAVGFSRWAMVAVAERLPYLRTTGAGSAMLADTRTPRNLMIASLTVIAATAPLISRSILGAAIAAIAITLAVRAFYRRWLCGVTGDLIGACGEIVEIAVLIAFAR
ncbi:MAG TPA: adenosylcobinamide-GDP ribazoletransferase [Candidatus Binataceae bacterium]|nr:adenosylcobinamide-GDP ribazoletransferase [Candidatus Binataceae bacterium]